MPQLASAHASISFPQRSGTPLPMVGLEEAVEALTLKTQREEQTMTLKKTQREVWIDSMIASADANAQELGFVDSRARAFADAKSGADGDAAAIDAFIRTGCRSDVSSCDQYGTRECIGGASSCRTGGATDGERSAKRWLLVRGILIEQRKIGTGGAHTPLHRVLVASVGVTAALGRVASFLSVESRTFDVARLPLIAARSSCDDAAVRLRATIELRRLVCTIARGPRDQLFDVVIATGVVPELVAFLRYDSEPALQYQAAWVLTNIASGTSDHTRTVIDADAVPILIQLLNSPSDNVREQAVWALGNIAGDSPECRDLVLHAGALAPLLSQLSQLSADSTKLPMLRNATWTLASFCRGKPQPVLELVKPALPTLAKLICSADQEVLTDACWALSYVSDGSNDRIQAGVESGMCPRLVELLAHPSSASVQSPALRALGNVVTGDDVQTQFVLDCGVLPALRSLLQSPMKSIRKDACWMISNITAGNSGQIQCVLESHLVLPLIEVLSEEDDVDIKKEAAWAITHAMSGGTPEQIKYLVTHGCIPPLCDLLGCHDAEMVTIALTGLEHILHAGLDEAMVKGGANTYAARIAEMGGLFKLENLHSGQHLENLRSWRTQRQLNRLNLRKNPGLGLSCDDSLNGLSNPPMKMTSSLVVDEKNFEKASNMLLTYFGFSSYVSEHPYKEEKEVATTAVVNAVPPTSSAAAASSSSSASAAVAAQLARVEAASAASAASPSSPSSTP